MPAEHEAEPAPPQAETPPESPPSPSSNSPAAAASSSHFDDTEGSGDTAGRTADRRREFVAGMNMYGAHASGVTFVSESMTINAPVTGGDYSAGEAREARLSFETIPQHAVDEIADVFVPPVGFEMLGEPFAEGRSLLLLGSRTRWGNTAAAVRVLGSFATVHRLRFDGPLATLPIDGLPRGCGFVMDIRDRAGLAAVHLHDVERLERLIEEAGSKLVVIVDAELRTQHGSRPVWRQIAAPPGARDVVLAHLRRRIGSVVQAGALIDQAGLDGAFDEMNAAAFDIIRLVELASDLAEVADGRGTVEDAVSRFADRATLAVEQWFDDVVELGDRATVLALAVLDGMPYDAVSRWAINLERRWTAEDRSASGAGAAGRRRSRRVRLAAARARLRTETWRTRYGPAQLETAAFLDGSYAQRILRHYWHEHDYDRELVLDWLREIGDDVEGRVAVRAALAVGHLATFAFDTVRRDVIVPWAGSSAGDERELAAVALALPARDPGTAGRAVRLVAEWSWRKGGAARITAARALGTSVGPVLNGGPDAGLTRLAKGADGRLSTALGDSIAELMGDADLPRQVELLALLNGWSTEGRNGRQLAGVLAFLEVAWTLWTTLEGRSWPTLLWLAEQGSGADSSPVERQAQELITELWGRVIIAPGADNGVRTVLGSWADAAQRDSELRSPFVRLLADAATTPRQAHLLQRHADRWRTRKPAAPDIARKLLDALDRGAIRYA